MILPFPCLTRVWGTCPHPPWFVSMTRILVCSVLYCILTYYNTILYCWELLDGMYVYISLPLMVYEVVMVWSHMMVAIWSAINSKKSRLDSKLPRLRYWLRFCSSISGPLRSPPSTFHWGTSFHMNICLLPACSAYTIAEWICSRLPKLWRRACGVGAGVCCSEGTIAWPSDRSSAMPSTTRTSGSSGWTLMLTWTRHWSHRLETLTECRWRSWFVNSRIESLMAFQDLNGWNHGEMIIILLLWLLW